MTDRELLEAAARAAGMETKWCQLRGESTGFLRARFREDGDAFPIWNPLTDDGDALRLAAKLRLSILPFLDGSEVCVQRHGEGFEDWVEQTAVDACAGWRRAIVRAAAAMGGDQHG